MKVNTLLLSAAIAMTLAACGPSPELTAPSADASADVKPVEAAPVVLPEVVANDYCEFNSPVPGSDVDKTKPMSVWGYAMNKANWTIPEGVSVRVAALAGDQKIVVPAKRGARKDVADALGKPEMENSGFGAEVDVSSLPAGSYIVSVLQEIDGKAYVCNGALPVNVK